MPESPTPASAQASVAAFATAFAGIAATRMRDMPLCNPALSVAVVGFRAWRDHQIGVLITPWCMNLICLPAAHAPPANIASGSPRSLELPSGDYDFLTAYEDSIGPYLSSSLFSPMFEFADMTQACSVAEAVMQQVFTAPEIEARVEPPAALTKLEQPVSRRGFLGALLPRVR